MPISYVLGLDLGQTSDCSALAILQRPPSGKEKPMYALPHLRRWPLGTPYPRIVSDVADLVRTPALLGSPVVVDQTGVGRPVVDLMREGPRAVRTIPVTITAGHSVTMTEDQALHVPKKELVSSLQVVLQSRRLRIARSLPEAETLVRELTTFQVRITASAHEQFGTWREGSHDDLVLAVALACWYAERCWMPPIEVNEGRGSRGLIADAPKGVFLQ